MGLGQPPDPESKPFRLRISFFGFTVPRPNFGVRARVAPAYADIYTCSSLSQALVRYSINPAPAVACLNCPADQFRVFLYSGFQDCVRLPEARAGELDPGRGWRRAITKTDSKVRSLDSPAVLGSWAVGVPLPLAVSGGGAVARRLQQSRSTGLFRSAVPEPVGGETGSLRGSGALGGQQAWKGGVEVPDVVMRLISAREPRRGPLVSAKGIATCGLKGCPGPRSAGIRGICCCQRNRLPRRGWLARFA